MPQSLSNVDIHLVFSTKNRTAWLTPELRADLYPYLAGITKNIGCHPVEIGGHIDHVHILFALGRTMTLAKYVEEIKTGSSKWMKTKGVPHFAWQNGYAAFSVSCTDTGHVIAYIRNQNQHHQVVSFEDEFRSLMAEANIELDERYVWD